MPLRRARDRRAAVCIAPVDATQPGEVGFVLLGEMLWLGTPALNLLGWLGLAAVMGGLVGFTLKSRG